MGASAFSDVEIKDGQGKVLRCIKLEAKRPEFLADAIPHSTRCLQGSDPTQWAMTNVQLLEFFNYMRSMPEYQVAKQARGHVCLYDVNSLFVIPWSRGFGCGVALLMNAHAPIKAQVMISHAWAEDVEELVSSLSSWASRIQPLSPCEGVPLWCCTFAQYQPEDGAGPSLKEQLSLDPFKIVIQSRPKHGMLVVHTTKADPYDRLWCVHEIDEALDSKLDVTGIGTYSLGGRNVCTRTAKCGCPADEKRIRSVIESKAGDYERLDSAIKAFRNTLLKRGTSVVAEIQIPWHNYTNHLLQNLEGLGLDKVCCDLLEFGVGQEDLFGSFTLTDSDGCKIPFEQESGGSATHSIRILKQPLQQQQFPLKMACALDVSCRHRSPQNEYASDGCFPLEKVVMVSDRQAPIWNDMKLRHPVLHDLFRCDFRKRDLSHFSIYLRGPRDTTYDGWLAAGVDIPNDYPLSPPKFKITKILRPDVAESGVCLDFLFDEWAPWLNRSQVLLSVVSLLGALQRHDPVNAEAPLRLLPSFGDLDLGTGTVSLQ
eukprot:s3932_g2.t1